MLKRGLLRYGAATVLLAGVALTPASPALAGRHAPATVRSGDARFEVLSPTLIRTEYAQDGRFVDKGTFNVVGRDDFKPVHVSKHTDHGWLTIDTGAVTLRYRVGSGPFTADNLLVKLRAGQQVVQAAPWAGHTTPDCAVGMLCEAEALAVRGPGIATDHRGYTGSGFAAGFQTTGDALGFVADPATAGAYQLSVRYANSTGGDGQNVARTLTVSVDGGPGRTLTLPPTANWDTWGLATVPLDLPTGRHEVSVARAATDSGNVNVDSLAIVHPGDAYPAPVEPGPQ